MYMGKLYQNSIDTSNTISSHFLEKSINVPNNIAIRFRDLNITYKDLSGKVNQMACGLRNKGVNNSDVVGILANRSIEMLVGILAILEVGGAYLPIDPNYPDERINYMLEDSNTRIMLIDRPLKKKVKHKCEMIFLDEDNLHDNNNINFERTNNVNDLAYVIYTSGSTGKPKGVMIEHKSVINFIKGVTKLIDFSEGKRILALTTMSFDIFVLETLLALTQGLTVVLADENVQKNPRLLSELISDNIDMIQMTPSRMQLLINYDKELKCLINLKEIMIGGEAFSQDLLVKLKSTTNAKVFNMYGPTETTVWSTISDLTKKNCVDIGNPINNTQIYIVDEENSLVPEGVEGELCIGGNGLARGYLNKPELTAERFIPNSIIPGEKIYKTGDLAKWLPNGSIKCFGRIDNQVKIRGYRVELEEIENVLLKHKAIKQVVVTAWKEKKDNVKYLCAYYVSDEEVLSTDFQKYMKFTLPEYMVPAYFMRLKNIPQTPNGKTDRKALPEPEAILSYESQQKVDQQEEKLGTPIDLKIKIREIVRDSIDVPISLDRIDLNSNLADLGVNSITYIKILVAIETKFDFEFANEELGANNFLTVKSLVEYVENRSIN